MFLFNTCFTEAYEPLFQIIQQGVQARTPCTFDPCDFDLHPPLPPLTVKQSCKFSTFGHFSYFMEFMACFGIECGRYTSDYDHFT